MDHFPDWSGILLELLVKIACCLPLIEDFTAFRGVCTNWRAAGAAKTKLFKGLGRVPLLMLSEKDDSDNDNSEREFYSLSKSKIFMRMPVPEAKGKKCIDAGFGWVLTVYSPVSPLIVRLVTGGEVSLFNPFTSATKIELPNTLTFPEYERCRTYPEVDFIEQAVLSANPSLTSNFTVFVVVNSWVGCWRSGDKSWTRLDLQHPHFYGGICYYKHKMYAIDLLKQIWTWDGTDPTTAQMILKYDKLSFKFDDRVLYLVESSDGELLIISRHHDYVIDKASHFEVMRLDLVKGKYEVMNGIGKDAVFLGYNKPVALAAADYPGVLKPNCIYFTDEFRSYYLLSGREKGKDMGIYNFEDGSIERFDIESFSHVCPPMWMFPSF